MGNTLIKDSITGNIMSLNDGFIPIGMKEHGGVLYIASYNPDTKEGELGSIPSPILHYSFGEKESVDLNNVKISDITQRGEINDRIYNNTIYLSDRKLHGGDKFITCLNINAKASLEPASNLIHRSNIWTLDYNFYQDPLRSITEEFPIITRFKKVDDSYIEERGWYSVKLYSIVESGKEITLDKCIQQPQKYYVTNDENLQISPYWFVNQEESELDVDRTRLNSYFCTYPNIPSGKLAIKFIPEYHKPLEHLYNETYQGNYPMVYQNDNGLFVIVHGFQYMADCPIQPDKIVVRANGLPIVYGDVKTAISNQHDKFVLTRQDNKSGHFCAEGGYVSFKNSSNHYILSNRFPIETIGQDEYEYKEIKSVNQDDENTLGLFAIKISDMNTDIKLSVDLYVYTGDEYVQYASQEFATFNPAIVLLGTSNIVKNFKPQYLDVSKLDNDSFDIQLFNKPAEDSNENMCFIADSNGNILKYDETNKKYLKSSDPKQTLDEYSKIKTYIYPQYTFTAIDSTGKVVGPRFFATNNKITGSNYFVQCSDQPKATYKQGNNLVIKSLLIPCRDQTEAKNQKYYLKDEVKNSISKLSQSDFEKYCLYGVNLNIINNFTTTLISDYNIALYGNWWDHAGKKMRGDKPSSCENYLCWEDKTYWKDDNKKDEPFDETMIIFDGTNIKSFETPQQGIDNPMQIPKRYDNFELSCTDFDSYLQCPIGSPRDRYDQYTIPYISYKTTSNRPIDKYCGKGFVNMLMKNCPGYITDGSKTIRLTFINYTYPENYLYDKPIDFYVHNLGNDYITYLSRPTYNRNTYKSKSHSNLITCTQELTGKSIESKKYNITEIYQKIQIEKGSSILSGSTEINISKNDNINKLTCKLSLKDSSDTDVVISPQLFVQLLDDDMLNRPYKSQYKVATQLEFSNDDINYGIYKNGEGAYSIVPANVAIDKDNLLKCCDFINDEEFLNTEDTVTPKEIKTGSFLANFNDQLQVGYNNSLSIM